MGGLSYNLPEFALMNVTVQLTLKGLEHYTHIIGIVYQYIDKMKALSAAQWKGGCVHQAVFESAGC